MKICIAQTKPFKGDIQKNMQMHLKLIHLAAKNGADLIAFPELSLTGYEPALVKNLATNQEDAIFDTFQAISDQNNITLALGIPTKSGETILISMVILQPNQPRQTYSKQYLHEDELPYFGNGDKQVFLTIQHNKIAPAICYESLLPTHAENAAQNGVNIYLASVAKSIKGIEKARKQYPIIAKKHKMMVLMANCVGYCDNFESVGMSAIWNKHGNLVAQLDELHEGILMIDTPSQKILKITYRTTA